MKKNKLPVILELEEVQNLLKQPNKRYPTGLRNKAIMSLMLHCGLKLSEITNLKPGNLNGVNPKNWTKEWGKDNILKEDSCDISSVCYNMATVGRIEREKKGNTYLLTVEQYKNSFKLNFLSFIMV